MTQYTWSDDDETTEVTYSTLSPGERRQIPLARATPGPDGSKGEQATAHAALPDTTTAAGGNAASPLLAATMASRSRERLLGGGVDDRWPQWQDGEHRPVRSVRGIWPLAYRRTFRVVFCGALLALGMLLSSLLSALAPGQAVALLFHIPAAPSARPDVSAPPTAPTATSGTSRAGTGEDALAPKVLPTVDARFAIATLSIHCTLNPCDEVQDVAAGQRIYPRQDGVPCTTTSAVAVVGHSERYVYCRLDQPNVFTYTFDGAQFDCVGAWLGCHTVVIVDTTNGR